MSRSYWVIVLLALAGCSGPKVPLPPKPPVIVHILPAKNQGCEVICKDGVCTIKCPYTAGCKPEGEAVCVIVNGEVTRNRMTCCPMFSTCHACKCLKDGTYKGYCKDGMCVYHIPIK